MKEDKLEEDKAMVRRMEGRGTTATFAKAKIADLEQEIAALKNDPIGLYGQQIAEKTKALKELKESIQIRKELGMKPSTYTKVKLQELKEAIDALKVERARLKKTKRTSR